MPLNRRLLFCPSAQLPEPLGASDATRLSHGAGEAVWLCLRHVIGSRTSPEPRDSALVELVPSSQEGAFSFLTSLPVSTPRDLGSWSSSLSQVWPPLGQQWLTPHHAVPFFTLLGYSGHYPHKRCYVFLPRSTAGCRWYSRGREEHCLSRGLLLSGGQSSTTAVTATALLPQPVPGVLHAQGANCPSHCSEVHFGAIFLWKTALSSSGECLLVLLFAGGKHSQNHSWQSTKAALGWENQAFTSC